MLPNEGAPRGAAKGGSSEVKALNLVSLVITILGGINWLIVGLFKYEVVSEIFDGSEEVGARIVYTIVGVAALLSLASLAKVAKND